MKEKRRRTLARSATWRCVGIAVSFALARVMGLSIGGAATLSASYHAIQFVLYYAHERTWDRLAWGVSA